MPTPLLRTPRPGVYCTRPSTPRTVAKANVPGIVPLFLHTPNNSGCRHPHPHPHRGAHSARGCVRRSRTGGITALWHSIPLCSAPRHRIAPRHRPWTSPVASSPSHLRPERSRTIGIPRGTPGQPLHTTLGRTNATQKETTAHSAAETAPACATHCAPRNNTTRSGPKRRPPFAEYGKAHTVLRPPRETVPPTARFYFPHLVARDIRTASGRAPAAPGPISTPLPRSGKKTTVPSPGAAGAVRGEGPCPRDGRRRFLLVGGGVRGLPRDVCGIPRNPADATVLLCCCCPFRNNFAESGNAHPPNAHNRRPPWNLREGAFLSLCAGRVLIVRPVCNLHWQWRWQWQWQWQRQWLPVLCAGGACIVSAGRLFLTFRSLSVLVLLFCCCSLVGVFAFPVGIKWSVLCCPWPVSSKCPRKSSLMYRPLFPRSFLVPFLSPWIYIYKHGSSVSFICSLGRVLMTISLSCSCFLLLSNYQALYHSLHTQQCSTRRP